jgi:hypothetical protein
MISILATDTTMTTPEQICMLMKMKLVAYIREWIFLARATCSSVFKKNQKWYFKVLKKF